MSYRVQFISPETKLSQELAAGAVNSGAKLRDRQIAHCKLTATRVMLAGLSCKLDSYRFKTAFGEWLVTLRNFTSNSTVGNLNI